MVCDDGRDGDSGAVKAVEVFRPVDVGSGNRPLLALNSTDERPITISRQRSRECNLDGDVLRQ